jgi:hypothetical protein
VRTSSLWVMVSVRVAAALMLVSLVVLVELNSCMRCTFACVLEQCTWD